MASYTISPIWGAGAQLFDNSGRPLSGGKIYTYQAGTTTPAVTYTTPTGSVANSNPIVADSAGRLTDEIWFPVSGAYKFVLKTANDVTLATYDNIPTTPQPPITNDASSISYEQGYEVTAGGFTVGATYLITSIGNTDFVAIGAAANSTGILFTATGVGSGTGTAKYSQTIQAKLQQTISVKDFGAIGNGVANDTTAIQTALDKAGIIYIVDGTYLVEPLFVKSNTTLIFSPNSSLKTITGYTTFQKLLNFSAVSNITIFGNKATIEMLKNEYPTGGPLDGFRHAVDISNCTNISIYDLTVKNTGGDGFYLNGSNISLINCVSDNAKRNGLSIISGSNINILGGEYKNTIGAAPQFGIDIEPDLNTEILQNINIIGVKTSNNKAGGISFVPINTTSPVSINVNNCLSLNDGSPISAGAGHGMLFALSPSHTIAGEIKVTNCTIDTPQAAGVTFYNWTSNCPRVVMSNVNVINPGAESAGSAVYNNGFSFNSDSGIVGDGGNIALINCSAKDIRNTPYMQVGCFFQTNYSGLNNIYIENFQQVGQVAGYTSNVVFGSGYTVSNVRINTVYPVINATSNTEYLARDAWGNVYTNSGETQHTIHLPTASNNVGLEISFNVAVNGGWVRIIPDPSDTILRYASDAGISVISRNAGDYIKLTSIGNNQWEVTSIAGQWNAFVGENPTSYFRISNGNMIAAPTLGTWVVGDIVHNQSPTAGGYIGWVCVSAGTPGTWKGFGAIAS